MTSPESTSHSTPAGRIFVTTHWSVVLSAREKDSPDSEAARERLCRIYWPPLYHFIRREGYSPHDAQDLTQEFLSRFLHRDGLDHLIDQRGTFRSFPINATELRPEAWRRETKPRSAKPCRLSMALLRTNFTSDAGSER